ncbi:hypothetical protein LCGC14_0267390 [marine sediment metagenome]|uniref:Uncharacterized protein n=1 Tax=marine sediment metagenome TaxID=412755 RepID=A0A0F9X4T3_9ZZZZ
MNNLSKIVIKLKTREDGLTPAHDTHVFIDGKEIHGIFKIEAEIEADTIQIMKLSFHAALIKFEYET